MDLNKCRTCKGWGLCNLVNESCDAYEERNTTVARGIVSIKDIAPNLVKKYNLKVGQIMRRSGLQITE